jgi:hypothetical protein
MGDIDIAKAAKTMLFIRKVSLLPRTSSISSACFGNARNQKLTVNILHSKALAFSCIHAQMPSKLWHVLAARVL